MRIGNSYSRNEPQRRPFQGARSALLALLLAILLSAAPAPASATVELTFYSKELGSSFPHAFVTLHGVLDRSGQRVDKDYGFSAKAISPAILFGAVTGEVIDDHGAAYIRGSDKHFSLDLADSDYDRVIGEIERWRRLKQPSYDLNRANCVHFVADLAAALGMKADTSRLMKKPRSFLNALTEANRAWLLARHAHFFGAAAARSADGAKP